MAQVALAWLLRQPTVASVVIGATSLAQLESNIKAAFLELTEEQVSGKEGERLCDYYRGCCAMYTACCVGREEPGTTAISLRVGI